MPENRVIENFGIMKLTPIERGSNNLLIQTDVIQLPYSEYLNVRTNPPKGHYGYACFMDGEYVLSVVDIQFRRQILLNYDRYIVQLAWQEFCNSKTIAAQLGVPLPDTTVEYPIWLCKEIRFKLEPGVVLNVFKTNIPPVTCVGSGISEPNLGGNPPGLPSGPSLPPPPDAPDSEKIPLSSPYEGDDDNGNTYVRDIPELPPEEPTPQGDCNKVYSLTYQYTATFEGFSPSSASGSTNVFGGFIGIFADGGRIVLRSDRTACGRGIEENVLAVGPSAITEFSGSATLGGQVG